MKLVDPGHVHADVVGGPVRLGKREPRKDKRTLKFGNYVVDPKTGKKLRAGVLPRRPSVVTNSQWFHGDWGELGNADYGDCTVAGAGHAIQVTSAMASRGASSVLPSTEEILAAYWATGSPSTPGADDSGRYELDVLNYWRGVGIAGVQATAYAALALPRLEGQARYAIDLFGFCYVGLALPVSAQRQTRWMLTRGADAKPGGWGGHAVALVDYTANGPTCVTWGRPVAMTWGWLRRYCDEAYCVVLPTLLDAAGESPAGFNVAQLLDDVAAITG